MVALIGASLTGLGEKYHQRKMRPLRKTPPPSRHPTAVAAASLPLEAQEDAMILLGSISAQSPRIDTFATWTLAVVGGSATLIVSNLDSITLTVPRYYVSLGLILLGVAALFGVAEKWMALRVQATSATGKTVKTELEARDEGSPGREEEDFDIVDVFDQVVRAFPWWMKGRLVKRIVKVLSDPLFASRSNARMTFWQIGLAAAQVLLFVAFIFLMALGVLN
jgi:hypothetical protein